LDEVEAAKYVCPDCNDADPEGARGASAAAAARAARQQIVPVPLTWMSGRHKLAVREKIEARYGGPMVLEEGKEWLKGWIAAINGDGTCDVHYVDGDQESTVPYSRIRVYVSAEMAERAAVRGKEREAAAAARAAAAAERQTAKDAVREARLEARAVVAAERQAAKNAVREAREAERAERQAAKRAKCEAAREASTAERDTQLRWVPLTTLAGTHQLTVGERVQGKFQGALGGVNWFDGCVTALHSECGACDIMYDDGDSEERVSARFIKVSVTGLEVKAVRQQQRQQSVGESAADEGSDAAGEGEATRAGAEGDAGTGDDADATEEADGSVEEPEEVEVLLDSAGRPIHLCGTFGCTLPDNHKGLHRVPDDGRGRLRRGKR
jgi:hypothetical protein